MHEKVVSLGFSEYRDAELGRAARRPNLGLSNITTPRYEAKAFTIGIKRFRGSKHCDDALIIIAALQICCSVVWAAARCCHRHTLQYRRCHVMLDRTTLGACCGNRRGFLTAKNALQHVVSLAEVQMAELDVPRSSKHAEQVTSRPPQC
jgi:hypothetical protein